MLDSTSDPIRSRIGRVLVGASVMVAVAACGTGVLERPARRRRRAPGPPRPTGRWRRQLTGEVSDAGALTHLQALQKIADENGGNRAAGTSGYEASVEYVVGVLRGAGFEVSTPTYEVSGDDDEVCAGTGRNVVAQTRTGDPGRVVMIGAHLDSVPEGPGIVDNGSGVASLLEIATRLGAEPSVQNTVRFAFFGHEETGAQGSTGYVEGLSADDREKIKLYLNVDMVASPNGGYFVQGGKGSDEETAGPAGFGRDRTGARRPAGQDRGDRPGDHRVRRGRRVAVHRGGHPGRRRRERRREGEDGRAGQRLGRAGRPGLRPLLPPGL